MDCAKEAEVESERGSGGWSSFRVMQWNVLADGLAQLGDFVRTEVMLSMTSEGEILSPTRGRLMPDFARIEYLGAPLTNDFDFNVVPKKVLEWDTRAPKILDNIVDTLADVVCLQELNHYDDFFFPQMQQRGFDGVFNPKKFSPAAVRLKYGFPPDGCAVLFKTSKFFLKEGIQLKHAIICRLQTSQTGQELVLATTHLKAKRGEENDAIRAQQVQELLENLLTCTNDGRLPSIICGDFNTNPLSAIYGLMRNHVLSYQSVYALTLSDVASYGNLGPKRFISDTPDSGGAESEPPFTTWKFRSTGEKQETIDYIWFADRQKLLSPRCLWDLPNVASIGVHGLPSEAMPSDHLPLLCDFAWKHDLPQ